MMVTGQFRFNDVRATMTDDDFRTDSHIAGAGAASEKRLPAAARRALEEASRRREEYRKLEAALPRELGGRGGNEPGRYGDWEVKGLASDF
jgi:hypothetical protein